MPCSEDMVLACENHLESSDVQGLYVVEHSSAGAATIFVEQIDEVAASAGWLFHELPLRMPYSS